MRRHWHQVGTRGVELAADYLEERCLELQELALQTRPDLVVEVRA